MSSATGSAIGLMAVMLVLLSDRCWTMSLPSDSEFNYKSLTGNELSSAEEAMPRYPFEEQQQQTLIKHQTTDPLSPVEQAGAENDLINYISEEVRRDEEIALKSAFLLKLLQENERGPLPLLYIEDEVSSGPSDFNYGMDKRSGRYYRRYPWKRQNNRYRTYEADTRYNCVPSREDVFKLLISLHEHKNGNEQKTVKFCNRKRPAKAIFTNIRFLG